MNASTAEFWIITVQLMVLWIYVTEERRSLTSKSFTKFDIRYWEKVQTTRSRCPLIRVERGWWMIRDINNGNMLVEGWKGPESACDTLRQSREIKGGISNPSVTNVQWAFSQQPTLPQAFNNFTSTSNFCYTRYFFRSPDPPVTFPSK